MYLFTLSVSSNNFSFNLKIVLQLANLSLASNIIASDVDLRLETYWNDTFLLIQSLACLLNIRIVELVLITSGSWLNWFAPLHLKLFLPNSNLGFTISLICPPLACLVSQVYGVSNILCRYFGIWFWLTLQTRRTE